LKDEEEKGIQIGELSVNSLPAPRLSFRIVLGAGWVYKTHVEEGIISFG
jgi:hypothetical protein